MTRVLITAILALILTTRAVFAQTASDVVWVQIEAQPSLSAAQDRIRAYSARLQDVNGFSLGGGWYAIALGPYRREDADQVLRVYRREGEIPRDSYIAFSTAYRQQFWPLGANLLNLPPMETDPAQPENTAEATPDTQIQSPIAPEVAPQEQAAAEATPEPAPAPAPEPEPADETPREARQSEAQLNRDERMNLQIALKWAGFYDSTIDGAFGRGTRNSMAQWQEANNYDVTGVLTTLQRAALFDQYNAVLKGLDLQTVANAEAGIEMTLPLGVVEFEKFEPPFAHYAATGDLPARVLLISQNGDRASLHGLYDIMQTLEIVPEDGPRERDNDSFMLVGIGADFVSHTQATLRNGEIKGFTLIWPAGDEERRSRLLGAMQQSFARLPGTLDPAAGDNENQSVDLLAGLEIRKPKISRSGFFIDANGTVVTTAEAVAECSRITLNDETDAEVVSRDAALGVAVLKPLAPLAPVSIASFQNATPRLQSDVAVAGYPFGGVLGLPTLTYGTLEDIRGLQGEDGVKRLALNVLPGDAGGPVLDAGGAVLGMLLPADSGTRKLPEDVNFATDAGAIRAMLEGLGLSIVATDNIGNMPPSMLNEKASGMTVLVNCWD